MRKGKGLWLMVMGLLSVGLGFCSAAHGWQFLVIDHPLIDGSIQMANHPTKDRPAVVYMSHSYGTVVSEETVKYAELIDGFWDISVVETLEKYVPHDWDAGLSFHPKTGMPHVTYFDKSWNLKYAYLSAGTWHSSVVVPQVESLVTSFVLDANGSPWIAFDDDNALSLKIAQKQKGKWNISTFAKNAACPTLAINPATGYPAMVYYKATSLDPPRGQLWYASFDGSRWQRTRVDGRSFSELSVPSLAFNPKSKFPAVAYAAGFEEDQAVMRYAQWNGTKWALTKVADGFVFPSQVSLAFDPVRNKPAIVYESINEELIYASGGKQWTTEVVPSSSYYTEWPKSLCFSKDGKPRIVFQGDGLRYAFR